MGDRMLDVIGWSTLTGDRVFARMYGMLYRATECLRECMEYSDGRQSACAIGWSTLTGDRMLDVIGWSTLTGDRILDMIGWSTLTGDRMLAR